MINTARYLQRWARYVMRRLWFTMWPAARIREGDRLLRQLAQALDATPSKHDDPEYRARFLQTLFDGTHQRGHFEDSGAASPVGADNGSMP